MSASAVLEGDRLRDAGRRNTAVLVGFTAVTNLADGVVKMALPLLAVRVGGSPAQVTGVALAISLPWLLVALHAGVLVDRVDRRRLLWIVNVLRLLAMVPLLAAAASGDLSIALLAAAGAAIGVADVVASTAATALVPAAVPAAGRDKANAWMAGAETVFSEFAGPFVGGLLIALGAGWALGATWAAYAAAALVLLLLVGRFRAGAVAYENGGEAPATTVNGQIAEGLRYLWQHRLLRSLSLILTVLSGTWGAWLALIPLYATRDMGLTPGEYGVLLSALGIGGLLGAVTVTWLNRVLGRRRVMLADLFGTAAMAAVPALTADARAVAAAAFLGGLGGTLWTVNSRTVIQRAVPDAMLGRFSSANRMFAWGAMPLGAGLVGLLAELAGPRAAFGFFAVASLLTVPFFLRAAARGADALR
ncbi:MFS transporter [Streptomyces sp. CMB-StM0423]|uniref:MFS transporter n=1 Tax=Streptomyces sp. CMB-StM0423 TaxID=2059884 RepID=UPI000C706326|nr:MFS transporter [Streptomyces sp. CMB-StM0423]AUH42877.1 MFS transporter [Streptomyces sp. CMB-StM0423]